MANSVAKPKKDDTQVIQAGLKAHALATTHKAVLEERLPAGLVDGLTSNLTLLGVAIPGVKQAKTTSQAATLTQEQALEEGYKGVTAMRTLVKAATTTADVRACYGVGMKVNAKLVKDVVASINLIVARAEAAPDEARSLGIVQRDLAELRKDGAAITSADDTQEGKRAGAPQATKVRNAALRRVVDATTRIAGAGVAEFAKNATIRADFEALLGAGNPTPKKPKKTDG